MANVDCLKVGERYITTNGCIVLITNRILYDQKYWLHKVEGRDACFYAGHCEKYSDGTEAQSKVTLSWSSTGLYGAHEDHPLTIVERAP